MTTTRATEIEEIRGRCEGLTADEWTYSNEYLFAGTPAIAEWTGEESEADRQFIAHARTDIPRLLEIIDELQKRFEWSKVEFVKYRTALNRIAHPSAYPSDGTPDKEIARRALIIGSEINPLPDDLYTQLRSQLAAAQAEIGRKDGALRKFSALRSKWSKEKIEEKMEGDMEDRFMACDALESNRLANIADAALSTADGRGLGGEGEK